MGIFGLKINHVVTLLGIVVKLFSHFKVSSSQAACYVFLKWLNMYVHKLCRRGIGKPILLQYFRLFTATYLKA
jgi:hypothetical protein